MGAFLSGFNTIFVPAFWYFFAITLGVGLALYIIGVLAAIGFYIHDKLYPYKPTTPHSGYYHSEMHLDEMPEN